jgi:hypothetical protein
MNLLKRRRKLDAAARNAVAVFEELRKPLGEVIALIQEVSALDLPQAERDMLVHEFTNLAAQMRESGSAATFAQALEAFRRLRDAMIKASQTSTVRKVPS